MADYEEFRLRIRGPVDGRYSVDSSGPGGEGHGDFALPFTDDQLKIFVLTLGQSRVGKRSLESTLSQQAREFGGALFGAVMAGDIGDTYRQALGETTQLRLTLSLDQAPELMTIPWEFLHDKTDFIATSPETPIVRSLPVAQPPRPLLVELPLRILVVSAQPKDTELVNAGVERANLEPALQPLLDRSAVVIDWLEHATLARLNDKLRSGGYHILHFIGHGGFVMDEGALVFETDDHLSDIVGADRFAPILKPRETIRLVVLNSCEGARSSVADPFSGAAASLIERGLPAAIGMQFEISNPAAIQFAKYFYAVLAEGSPVDRALAEARLAMFAGRDDVEWATPVLFMRGSDGRLFEIPNAVPIPREELEKPASPVTPPVAVPGPSWLSTLRGRIAGLSRRARLALSGGAVAILVAVALVFALFGPARGATVDWSAGTDPGSIVIRGSGFRANETVVVRTEGRTINVPVHADGTFDLPLDVGIGAAGIIEVTGQISQSSASTEFALRTPSQGVASSSPSNGGSSEPPPSTSPVPSPSVTTADLWCFDPAIRQNLIVFYSDYDGTGIGRNQLYCLDPDTGRVAAVTIKDIEPSDRPDTFVGWAPKHDAMIFTRGARGDGDVLTLGEDLIPRDVASEAADDWFPAWSANDDIAFIRGRGAGSAVWRREHDQTEPSLWFAAADISSIAWSPGGGTLAFFGHQQGRTDFDIGTVIADGATPDYVIANKGIEDRNPAWSPDGKKIVFVRGSPGLLRTNDIWVFDRGTHEQKQLTGIDIDRDGSQDDGRSLQDGNPVWSPDGKRIAFYRATTSSSGVADGYHIWVTNADGSSPRDLMVGRDGRNLDPNWR